MNDKRKQAAFDMIVTAVEGGINYWCQVEKYHWRNDDGSEDVDGIFADIVDMYSQKKYKITPVVISRGVTRALKDISTIKDTYMKQAIYDFRFDPENVDADANVADVIVQYGLLGEVVYG